MRLWCQGGKLIYQSAHERVKETSSTALLSIPAGVCTCTYVGLRVTYLKISRDSLTTIFMYLLIIWPI